MNIRVITLLMLCAINGYSQVKKKMIYRDPMTQLIVYQYDTLGAGKSYEIIGKDLRYQYVIDFDTYYKGPDVVDFINKVLTFGESKDYNAHIFIEGVKVTNYPKHIQLQKTGVVGYRVISKKKLKKIMGTCQSIMTL